MTITLRPKTQKLLEEQMKKGSFHDADDVLRYALETLGRIDAEAFEDLDPPTQAAIQRAEAQSASGQGRPWKDVKNELRRQFLKP